MVSVYLIVIIAVVVLAALVLMKIMKSILKVVSLMITVVFVIGGIVGILVAMDVNKLKEGMTSQKSLIMLQEGPSFEILPDKIKNNESIPFAVAPDSLDNSSYFRIFTIKKGLIEKSLPVEVKYDSIKIPKDDLVAMIYSDNPKIAASAGFGITENAVAAALGDDDAISSMAFALAVSSIISEKGSAYMISSFKDGSITVEPQSILFSILKYTPGFIIERFVKS